MHKLQGIFNQYYQSYLKKVNGKLPYFHQKVASDIMNCQTGYFGAVGIKCRDCDHEYDVMLGCGNRHCSGCQKSKGSKWAEKQKLKLLPGVKYFMVTFTIPKEARPCFMINKRFSYDALFKAASKTIQTLASDKKNLGLKNLGYFGVFHANGRTMNYHPHVHMIIPNIGFNNNFSELKKGRDNFIFDEKAASKYFRGVIMRLLENYIPSFPELESVRYEGWNVDIEQVGDGKCSLEYLSRYLFKSVIAESNILSWEEDKVTIQYIPTNDNDKSEFKVRKKKTLTLSANEFLRRFFDLVLPKGFMKVRHFGFLSTNPKKTIKELRDIILDGLADLLFEVEKPIAYQACCVKCDSKNIFMKFSPPPKRERNLLLKE